MIARDANPWSPYVYSDSPFKIDRLDDPGRTGPKRPRHPQFPAQAYTRARNRRGRDTLADDFALIRFQLGQSPDWRLS